MITPRTLKGFRDFLPELMLPREQLIETATAVYRSYGFCPIDTPALEYLEILQGKGSDETDKQLYQFTDHGGRQVGLRFDLTVPLARYTAQHYADLTFPFKRYHFGKVWRGENTQAGRYREFMQCDFDTIGTKSLAADIETALVINDLLEHIDLKTKQTFTGFRIRVNNRKVLSGLLDKHGIAGKSVPILRTLDKISKIGKEAVLREMTESADITVHQAEAVLQLIDINNTDGTDSVIFSLQKLLSGNPLGEEGVGELADLIRCVHAAGVPADRIVIDASIARGLDYYTGTIYETFLDEMPQIGSVCSGGRYDNLAGVYTKQELPGVGASLGLDRLISAMEELDMLEKKSTPVHVFLPFFAADRLTDYLKLAANLRSAGIGTEFYPEARKLGQQLKYADKRGFRFAVIVGEDEFAKGVCQIKDLKSGTSTECPIGELFQADSAARFAVSSSLLPLS
ncbi:MAG: histidine--tRNA ligase [Planctomycetaceae bacterium]|jgi:histidyl-tRNA synthetase|nr:histidine--tRNA ligase [Planctomycetaceae bacterium]